MALFLALSSFPDTLLAIATKPEKLFIVMSQGFVATPRMGTQNNYEVTIRLEKDADSVQMGFVVLEQFGNMIAPKQLVTQSGHAGSVLSQTLPLTIAEDGNYELLFHVRVKSKVGGEQVFVRHMYLQANKEICRVTDSVPNAFYTPRSRTDSRRNDGGKSESNDSPPTPISVSGRITFYDPILGTLPLSNVIVRVENIQICDPNCRPNPLFWEYRDVVTDDDGNYHVPNWFVSNTKVTPKIENGVAVYSDDRFFAQYYVKDSRDITGNITGADVQVTSAEARILQNLWFAGQFTSGNWGYLRPQIAFEYNPGSGVSYYTSDDDALYFYQFYPGSSGSEIWGIRGMEVSAHEYGHGIMYSAFGYMPLSDWSPPSGQGHTLYSVSAPVFAWKEGWAQFFSAAVWPLQVGNNQHGFETNPYAGFPFYLGQSGTNSDGRIVEGAVANSLWNLFDGVQTADGRPGDNDDANGLGPAVWNSFRNGTLTIITGSTRHVSSVADLKAIWDDVPPAGNQINTHAPGPRNVDLIYNRVLFGSLNMPNGALQSLDLQSVPNNQMNLTWVNQFDLTNDVTGTKVYRKQVTSNDVWDGTLNGFTYIGLADGTAATFADQNLNGGAYYRYVNHTFNSGGNSIPFSSSLAYANRTFAVALTAANFVEAGGAGTTYKVNGTDVGTTWNGSFTENLSGPIQLEAAHPSGWVFLNWSDGSEENPRTIVPTDHLTLHATFKLHLGSSTPNATGSTNQRKLLHVYWEGNRPEGYHLTYSSAGDAYYTRSVNGGATWSPEVLVSRGTGTALSPSIAEPNYWGDDTTYVVWIDTEQYQGQTKYSVFFRKVSLTTGQFTQIEKAEFGGYQYWARPTATPVAVRLGAMPEYPDVTVAFEAENAGIVIAHRYYYGSNGVVWFRQELPGSSVTSARPSMAISFDSSPLNVSIAYDEDGNVVFATSDAAHQTPVVFDSPEKISGDFAGNRCASLAVSPMNEKFVSWTSLDWYGGVGLTAFRHWDSSNGWGLATGFIDDLGSPEYLTSTICAHDFWGGATMFWSDRSVLLNMVTPDGFSWTNGSYSTYSSEFDFPNLAALAYPANIASVLTKNNQTPYEVKFEVRDNEGYFWRPLAEETRSDSLEVLTRVYRRVELRNLSGSEKVTALFGDVHLLAANGTVVAKVPFERPTTKGGILRTEAFRIGQARKIDLDFAVAEMELQHDVKFTVDLIDSTSGRLLDRILSHSARGVGRAGFHRRFQRSTSAINSVNPVYLRLEFSGDGTESLDQFLTSYVVVSRPVDLSKQGLSEGPGPLPTAFALHSGYPNPFNPSTQINYDLPEASHVTLVVYDVLGRKVTELVNGQVSQGYHTTTWDASGVASGIYFAHFIATDANGNIQLNKVSKLLLTK